MKHYLEYHKFYVMNEDKFIYEVNSFDTYIADYLQINLELIAGWDYVNPDENDIQGYVSADNFTEEVQTDFINQYFFVEGMQEALEANGYIIIKDLPASVKAIINKHNG